ncbi:MAG: ATP synthase F1 subunit epsilon [Elusimicrobiota bacterium]
MKKLLLTILTPTKTILEKKEVDSITLPAYDGEMCVLPGHIPYIAQLKEGILKYKDDDKEEFLSIFWGFFEVSKNNVIVLAEDASTLKEIDEEKLRQEYQKAKDALISKDKKYDLDELEIQIKKMVVNLKLAAQKKKYRK